MQSLFHSSLCRFCTTISVVSEGFFLVGKNVSAWGVSGVQLSKCIFLPIPLESTSMTAKIIQSTKCSLSASMTLRCVFCWFFVFLWRRRCSFPNQTMTVICAFTGICQMKTTQICPVWHLSSNSWPLECHSRACPRHYAQAPFETFACIPL